ncbi:MAG TPA: sugar ABC transporter ATP-binding protein [Firmicutes bacterium]|nr:sugar ABC transporter ATP-binding protein [Bacillota bacterium]
MGVAARGADASAKEKHSPYVLEMHGITKSFSGVKVLDDVELTLRRGEVVALLGQNGAGKSTLIKILNGDYTKDAGTIIIDGMRVEMETPRDAIARGIRAIYQEPNTVSELSVAENILLGRLPLRKPRGSGVPIVDYEGMRREAMRVLNMLDVRIDPDVEVGRLTVAERQIVEIARALSAEAKILIMDEPTAALTDREIKRLFEVVEGLKSKGVGIIYISHRLEEVFRIADRVMVLRDGRNAGIFERNRFTHQDLVRAMVGRSLVQGHLAPARPAGPAILSVENLSRRGCLDYVSFQVRAGEVVAFFGLMGSGTDYLAKALVGAVPVDGGTIAVDGVPVHFKSPGEAKIHGIGLVPADRKTEGLILEMSVEENITLPSMDKLTRGGFLRRDEKIAVASRWVNGLGIRCRSLFQPARFLSGGNQQKVLLAKWLARHMKVLVIDEPTRGVDVGAREDIYGILKRLAEEGMAIVVLSSDLPEVLRISNRILVLYKGRVMAEFSGEDATQERVLYCAMGGVS